MVIPVTEVEAPILELVIQYCEHHQKLQTTEMRKEEVEKWEKSFVDVDKPKLFAVSRAAYYLQIEGLVDLTCKNIAHMMAGKSAEQIYTEFSVPHGTHLY